MGDTVRICTRLHHNVTERQSSAQHHRAESTVTTANLDTADTVTREGHCIVGRRHASTDFEHGPYCERSVGSNADAVIETGWQHMPFWRSVIAPAFTAPRRASIGSAITNLLQIIEHREAEQYRSSEKLRADESSADDRKVSP
jgi:hypothetical protein